jgi:hypothetical protein
MKSGLVMVGLNTASFNHLFQEQGKVKGLSGLTKGGGRRRVTFDFKVMSKAAKFPGGDDEGEGTITWHDDDTVDASYQGSLMIDNERFEWQSIETGKVDGDVIKGLEIVTFPHSPKLKVWMNNFIMETEMNLSNEDFTNTAYELK